MNHLLGLIDALEAMVMDAKKVPFSTKIMIEEKQLMGMLEKLRVVVKSADENIVKKTVDLTQFQHTHNDAQKKEASEQKKHEKNTLENEQACLEAKRNAKIIEDGAKQYADTVFANLQLLITKMQTNLVKMESNINGGRDAIDHIQSTTTSRSKTNDKDTHDAHAVSDSDALLNDLLSENTTKKELPL